MAIHDKDEIPLIEEVSYGVISGMETYFILRKKEVSFIGKLYYNLSTALKKN